MPKKLFKNGHKINLGKKFKKKGVWKICPTCEKEFYVFKGEASRRKYCSKKCLFESKKWREEIAERQSNRKVSKKTKEKISKTMKERGIWPKSAWKGGISFEKYTVDWTKTLKRSIRERDKYVCQMCGISQEDRALDVHHIDYNKKNCNPDNLISLCMACHRKTNYNREYWVEYFQN